MLPKRAINAAGIVSDIQAGMTDAQLMERYRLSAKGLQSAFKKLVEAQAIDPEELGERVPLYEDTVTIEDMRQIVRDHLHHSVVICDAHDRKCMGRVRDISEKGVGIKGLQAKVNEIRSLYIAPDDFVEVEPFRFEGRCRWVKKSPGGDYSAGFEITNISNSGLEELRRLVHLINVSDA
jgi:PilZ domain